MMIQEFNSKHLKKLLNNQCDVYINREGISEEGEPLMALELKNQKCRFVEKTKVIINSDGKKVELVGKIILLGDIAPDIKKISGGEVIVNNSKYEIYQASRPRNPNGTIHHTTLELM